MTEAKFQVFFKFRIWTTGHYWLVNFYSKCLFSVYLGSYVSVSIILGTFFSFVRLQSTYIPWFYWRLGIGKASAMLPNLNNCFSWVICPTQFGNNLVASVECGDVVALDTVVEILLRFMHHLLILSWQLQRLLLLLLMQTRSSWVTFYSW